MGAEYVRYNPVSIQKRITEENGGRKVEIAPFSVKKNIDATGVKYSLKLRPQPGWSSV